MKVSPTYVSLGVNRSSSCAACTADGLLAFGAGKYVALWDSEDPTHSGIRTTLKGHKSLVTTVKLLDSMPGIEQFISGDAVGDVRTWSRKGQQLLPGLAFEAHPDSSISALGVAHRSGVPILFTGGSDGIVRIWSTAKDVPKETQKIDLKGKLPLDLQIGQLPGSDTLILVVACTDRRIQLYTEKDGRFAHAITLEGHEDWVRCLSLTPYPSHDDSATADLLLASGSQDNYIRLWRISSAAISQTEPTGDGLDLLDDFERKLAGEAGGSSQISTKAHVLSAGQLQYNVTLEALLIGHEAGLTNVHWSPPRPGHSPVLLSTSSDNSLVIWTPSSLGIWVPSHRFGALSGRGLAFYGAVWGKDGDSVMAAGWNGGWERWVKSDSGEDKWDVQPGLTGHHGDVKSVAWDPSGNYLVSVSSDQTTRIHAACRSTEAGPSTWAEIARPQVHGYDMTDIAWVSPLRFASSADEKVARVFDAPGGFVESLASLGVAKDDGVVVDAASRPKGATVPPLGLSNRALGREAVELDLPSNRVPNAAHDSISRTLTSLPTEEELASSTLWPEVEKVYGHGYELVAMASSHDGSLIASACRASNAEHAVVRLHSTATWDSVGEPLSGHTLTITRIAFNHDDTLVLTCSRDRGWRIFRKGAGEGYELEAKDERAHSRMVLDCCWSASGNVFATASRDKTVKIWSESPNTNGQWTARATIKLNEAVTAVDLVQYGDMEVLAVGTESGAISLHKIQPGAEPKLLHELDDKITHVAPVNRLAWRPSREAQTDLQLASSSDDRSVRVYDVSIDQ